MKRDRGRLGRVQAGERPTSGRKRKARLQGGSARHCRGLWATGIPRVQGPTMQTRGVRPQPSTEGRRCNAAGKYSNISRKAHRKPEEHETGRLFQPVSAQRAMKATALHHQNASLTHMVTALGEALPSHVPLRIDAGPFARRCRRRAAPHPLAPLPIRRRRIPSAPPPIR